MVEMARIKSEKLVDIFNYVRYMRTCRPMMVMNEVSQYNCTLLSFLLYFYQLLLYICHMLNCKLYSSTCLSHSAAT